MASLFKVIPSAFFWRRIHSLTGFGLCIFILFHLMTNAQAVFWVGQDGRGFIHSVNAINDIPYLELVEILFIALPLAIHAMWGVYYLRTEKSNAYINTGKDPYLPEYRRNKAYTWQRITSWILLFGILAHVIHMRFVERPVFHQEGNQTFYTVEITPDPGIKVLGSRLEVRFQEGLNGSLMATAKDFGTAELLMVREAFKSPLIMGLYTILVLSACFHAFNGLWTFLITWGIPLSVRSQMLCLRFTTLIMFIFTFLGLSTIYLTYFVNLR